MRTELVQMRVFIEGVLVPKVSGATVQTFANETATASITMPSVPGFETEELKRARVHIFWSDLDVRDERPENDWPILFEGEIVADGYSKSVNSRQQVFHCSGLHTYWEQVMLYYYDPSSAPSNQAMWTNKISVALGNQRFLFEGRIAGTSMRQRMVTEIRKNKNLPYHSIVKKIFRDALDVNNFFRLADQGLKLSNRFASAKDPNLDVLVGRNLLEEALTKDVLARQGESTMMTLLKDTLELFRYQIVHNAQPVFIDSSHDPRLTADYIEKQTVDQKKRLSDYIDEKYDVDESLRDQAVAAIDGRATEQTMAEWADKIIQEAQISVLPDALITEMGIVNDEIAYLDSAKNGGGELERDTSDLLAQYLLIPDTRFALPPACNVVFPGDQDSLSLDRQLLQEPTRGLGMPESFLDAPTTLYIVPNEIATARIPTTKVVAVSTSGFHPPLLNACRVSNAYGIWRIKTHDAQGKLHVQVVSEQKGAQKHKGIDLACTTGNAVYAIDDGKVTKSGEEKGTDIGHGNALSVTIAHATLVSYCTHLSRIEPQIVYGATVKRGQKIGEVGTTGGSTGPHLHFALWQKGQDFDPATIFPAYKNKDVPAYQDNVQPTASAPEPETEEKTIEKAAQEKGPQAAFSDHEYLTPEEELVGIVPFFDRNTLRAHMFMTFAGKESETEIHLLNMLNSEFLWRRYQTRSMSAINMPFNASPLAGFPALIVDRNRSMIGLVSSVTHDIRVGGGQGSASTTLQVESPRYWDEGDPYYWRGGKAVHSALTVGEIKDRNLPDPNVAVFPAYYLESLVATNSLDPDTGAWESETVQSPKKLLRPVDQLYRALLGTFAIPYQYAERQTVRGQTVGYNKAIYGREEGKKYPNTIVGRYYLLADKDPQLAHHYARNMTRRLGVSEQDVMVKVLKSQANSGGVTFWYQGPAFRSGYQVLVRKMNLILAGQPAFRG